MSEVSGRTSPITRSMDAASPVAIRDVERRRRTLPNGWWGVSLLVATEGTLFGTLIASYFYLRFRTTDWPPGAIEAPSIVLPLVLTGVLVLTSVPAFLGAAAARAGRLSITRRMLIVALLVQAGYLAVQILLFRSDLGKFSPKDTSYGSIYFTLLAVHHAHVLAGMLLEAGLLARLLGGLTNYRVVGVRVVALYWHFVNLAAIFVVFTQISPSL